MHFSNQPYRPGETIAAVATPPGEGGVAMIRISGDDAFEVADKVFSGNLKKYQSHTAHYGKILNANGEKVDDVLILPMKKPKTFTGEDVVEIFCHGGSLITRRVLETVLKAGARAAMAGEFTFKAFINGKIDLAQAEAIQDLICAKNERALEAAESQLEGKLSKQILKFQNELIGYAAILEAWVDFPEEGLEFAPIEEVVAAITSIHQEIEKLIFSFHEGRIIHDGLAICLVGSPNVGKSSLMNALLDKDRAIISDIPGTTRDVIEDHLRLNGINLKVIDTAGIREAKEAIEAEGIKRTHDIINKADLILLVLDATLGTDGIDIKLFELLDKKRTIVVWNKTDLPHETLPQVAIPHVVFISAKNKEGLENLHQAIDEVIWQGSMPSKEEILVTNVRHKEALSNAAHSLKALTEGLNRGTSPEFLMIEMRSALNELGKIIGFDAGEDILTAIFSKFCIGK